MKLHFSVNGRSIDLEVSPFRRLLDVLRDDLGLTGAKEGCGEGECGACAVLLDGRLVNACLVPALQLEGHAVTTIEGLGTAAQPDPVQFEFMAGGAIQCGFCTPGMVLASRALLDENPAPNRAEIRRGLAGNLCRCTGYERIVQAVERTAAGGDARPVPAADPGPVDPVSSPYDGPDGVRPSDLSQALDRLARWTAEGKPVTIVAGATDLLAGACPDGRDAAWLDIGGLTQLQDIQRQGDELEIGAGATFTQLANDPQVTAQLPILAQAARQVGSPSIRNRATIGGNLITASPCADSAPPLLALNARVVLAGAGGTRELPVENFFTDYRTTARRPDELLVALRIPIPTASLRQEFRKVGPREAQAISKLSLAAVAETDRQGILHDVRLAAGSVAPVPVLLQRTMALLEGQRLDGASVERLAEAAGTAAAEEVVPISDVRSTEAYRRIVLGRLVGAFVRRIGSAQA